LWGSVPGQEFVDAVNGVVGDARGHIAQVGFGSMPLSLAVPIKP
jgi:hypothetical protein